MSTLQVYDPEGSAEARAALTLSAGRTDWSNITIGILDNKKQHAAELMEMIARDFGAKFKNVNIVMESKESAAVPAPPEMVQRLVEQCDLVLTGTGD
jgi:hypothetical protein